MPTRTVYESKTRQKRFIPEASVPRTLGRNENRHVCQDARRVYQKSFCKGGEEAETRADLRQQSGPSGYAVGILFRHRVASSGVAHHADAAVDQKPRYAG